VVDLDHDVQLGPGDLVDGYGDEAGFYAVHDVTQAGPYPVTEILYSGGALLGQNTFYPTNVEGMGELPLVVVSHGNGHNYQWYDHIGYHLASYGYIVMSHENNTVPGIEAASTTTLTNTDYFLGHLNIIADGDLQGHVDARSIVWIGHSRGGESAG
jgi:predicted dienelactone hydrolase